MNEEMSDLPQAIAADPDGVQLALRAAHTLWSRGDTAESLKWLRKAAESASDEGADLRSLQLAKAAAELRARLVGASEPPRALASASGSIPPPAPGSFGAFPPSGVGPGESGSHPIAQPYARSDSEPPRAPSFGLSSPSSEALTTGSASDDGAASSSRPVTATQYPSHRPRQRVGHLSSAPVSPRDGTAYAAVPSWSADSERRPSAAPPPLPRPAIDDYEELEAEPEDEPADDPGSVWGSDAPASWGPAEQRGLAAGGATPPPLPHGGAFSEDESDFTQQSEAQTVVLPQESEPRHTEDSFGASGSAALLDGQDNAGSYGVQGNAGSFGVQGNAWDQQSRPPSWDHEGGSSWAAELHQSTWGQTSTLSDRGVAADSSGRGGDLSGNSLGSEPAASDPAPQSEAARAKLTARVHHQAVRVSFAPDLRVPGQYVVRPLREGEKAASGERVALLVALEPGVPLV